MENKPKTRAPNRKRAHKNNRKILNRKLIDYSIINNGSSIGEWSKKRLNKKFDECFNNENCKPDDCFNGIDIEYLKHNLPLLPYVLQQIIMFIFRVPLKCENDTDTEILQKFLHSKNIDSITNLEVLLNSIMDSMVYGRNGIRWLDSNDGIVSIPYTNYDIVTSIDSKYPTRDILQAYYIRRSESNGTIIKLSDTEPIFEQISQLKLDTDYSEVIPDSEFVNLRWYTNKFIPKSPLTYDSQRIRLILTFYQALIDKLNENGVGRLLFQLSEDYIALTNSQISNNRDTKQTNDEFTTHVQKIAQQFADDIRHSDPDAVLVVPPMFENEYQHFENDASPDKLMGLFKFEELVIPQVYGFTPSLLGLGTLSDRNVSIAATNATAEATIVTTLREKFCSQFAPMLEKHLNLSTISFDNEHISTRTERLESDGIVAKTAESLAKAGYPNENINSYINKELSKGEN